MGELFIIFPCCILNCYETPPSPSLDSLDLFSPPLSLSGQFIIFSLFLFFSSFFLFFPLQNIRMGKPTPTHALTKMVIGGKSNLFTSADYTIHPSVCQSIAIYLSFWSRRCHSRMQVVLVFVE